jgi:hypothetical protein
MTIETLAKPEQNLIDLKVIKFQIGVVVVLLELISIIIKVNPWDISKDD